MAQQVSLQNAVPFEPFVSHTDAYTTKRATITSSSLSAFRFQNVVRVQLLRSNIIRLASCIYIVAGICPPEHNYNSNNSRAAQTSALVGWFLIQVLTVLGKFIEPRSVILLLLSIGCWPSKMKDSLRLCIDRSHSSYGVAVILYIAEKALKFAGVKRPWRPQVGKQAKKLFGFLFWGLGFVVVLFLVSSRLLQYISRQQTKNYTTTAHMVPVLELRYIHWTTVTTAMS